MIIRGVITTTAGCDVTACFLRLLLFVACSICKVCDDKGVIVTQIGSVFYHVIATTSCLRTNKASVLQEVKLENCVLRGDNKAVDLKHLQHNWSSFFT